MRYSHLIAKSVLAGVLSALVFLVAAGCSGSPREDALDRVQREGVLRIGTDATYPPFESKDVETGGLVGFDIDLMGLICRELGVEPEFTVVPFDGIIAGLFTRKYDVLISAMTITPERSQAINFTKPYYRAGQSIAVALEDTLIKGFSDLRGKRIGAQLGTTGEMKAKSIPEAQVTSFDHIGAAFIDLANGRLDAIINDRPTSKRIIASRGDAKIVGETLTDEYYGIGVRKQDTRLLEALNRALDSLKARGELDSLNGKWFGPPDDERTRP